VAKYIDNAKSFITGLSDFWTLYFQEIDQLEYFYKGAEILVGQSYLDLLSLLLNNSVQDCTIFNKEYFKLLLIDETDIQFKAGTTVEANRYQFILPDDMVFSQFLNNKILTPNFNLDRNVDYYINEEDRSFEFIFDPTNAYLESTYGDGNSALKIRSKVLGADAAALQIHLSDTGAPLDITRSGFDITVTYDGPANTNTTTVLAIVQAINLDPALNGLIQASIAGLGTGTGSPPGTVGLAPLEKVSVNTLDGFAARQIEKVFGSQFTDTTIANWVSAGVEKGDILRLISGPSLGSPVELDIDLVRETALYTSTESTAIAASDGKVEFAIIRTAASPTSEKETFANSGFITQSAADGVLTGASRNLFSPSATFSPVHEGDIIELLGTSNVLAASILAVVDASNVTLGATNLVDESPLVWNLHSVLDPTNIAADGILTNNGDGTATFTAASATFTSAAPGTVLKLARGGFLEFYDITGFTGPTTITLSADTAVADGAGIDWGWARYKTPTQQVVFSPPSAWPKADTFTVTARRLIDSQAVQEGTDYVVRVDTGQVEPLTVWRTSLSNTVTYDYRDTVVENSTPLLSGVDGTITSGSPNTFSSPTAAFVPEHVGYAIQITNSGLTGATNNGTHFIAAYVSATVVELSADKVVPTTADPNNGALGWELFRRGTAAIEDITAVTSQISFWAPDALIDRFHLYNTFGYLIKRFERSSEEYRSLIRGLFQLFMLGPTLERFESAINTVAGLPVIRDEGEILIRYDDGALQSGTDGFFDFSTKTFTAASAAFVVGNQADFIFAATGANEGKIFKIATVVDTTTVILEEAPTTDGPSNWELTDTAIQTVRTSRTTYEFSRIIPLRDKVTDPANVGVLIFRAFEVLTDVFEVTDYVETPTWFDFVQIPEVLMPDQTSSRRQSTPSLFENVVGPADEGSIGDPGLIIGADSEGFIPPSVFVRDDAGALDGELFGDISFPFSNDVFFESPTAAFTNLDLNSILVIDPAGAVDQYRILSIVSATRVQIEAFEPVTSAAGLDWELRTGPLAKRHKAAFVILNQFLKHHLFFVRFDVTLLTQLSGDLLADLQELVFVAKPTYTYLVLSPSALFQEIIQVDETFEYNPTLSLGGGAGSIIAANENPLLVIGSSWRIGNWFRYVDKTDIFVSPAASIPQPLGPTAVGYSHYPSKIVITPADFTSGGTIIQTAEPILRSAGISGTGTGTLSVVGGVNTFTAPPATFADADVMNYITITGSGAGNDGTHRIGAVPDDDTVILSASIPLTSEASIDWEIFTVGTTQGDIVDTDGVLSLVDAASRHPFIGGDIGTYVRRPFVNNVLNQSFVIGAVPTATSVELTETHRVEPIAGDPDITVDITSNVLTATPSDFVFNKLMATTQRALEIPATKSRDRYYIVFTSGVNAGTRAPITVFLDHNQVTLGGAVTDDPAADVYLEVTRSFEGVSECADWEHVQEQIVIDGTTIDLSNTPTQDANPTVSFTAYGVREPDDPATATFDETQGDTLYSVGMPDPRQARGKSRTGRDTDLREDPIEITRT
jgi:hypothetical protein